MAAPSPTSSHRTSTGTATGPSALTPTVWAALGVVYVVWGSTYLGMRVVVTEGLPPYLSMGGRFLVAGAILALVLAARGGWRRLHVTRHELGSCAVVGLLLLAGGNGLVAFAEQDVPSGLAALLVATTPLWLVAFRAVTGDRPRWATWVGTAVGFAGVAVLARPGGHEQVPLMSTLLVVVATFFWASGTFAATRLRMPADPFVPAALEMLLAAPVMILIGLVSGEGGRLAASVREGVSPSGLVAWVYLVVFGSLLAFTAYYWLLRHAPISLVATYAYVNPVVAVLLGWALLSEQVTATIVLGGALAVAGVLLVVSTERRHSVPSLTRLGGRGDADPGATDGTVRGSVGRSGELIRRDGDHIGRSLSCRHRDEHGETGGRGAVVTRRCWPFSASSPHSRRPPPWQT